MEWTMGECFIKAFKGELSCYSSDDVNNDITPIYLSTKKGKHPIKIERVVPDMVTSRNVSDTNNAYHPSWKQVIEYLSDEMARIKPDRLTTLFLGDRMKQFLDQPCIYGDNTDISAISCCTSASIPRDKSWMDPFRRDHHAINDLVYIKLAGHSNVDAENSIDRLGWFPGRIISVQDSSEYSVELYDTITKTNWTVTVPLEQSSLLCSLPFKIRNPLVCANVIANLANKLAYYDITVPPGINVKALWNEDDKYYNATTVSRHEISWKEVDLSNTLNGPCVPIRWEEDGSISFESTSSCVIKKKKDEKEITLADKSSLESAASVSSSMDAMMTSLALQGKKLHGDQPLFGSADEDAVHWEAYDIESASWEKIQLMNKVDPSILPLKVIAYHMCYGGSESFSIVYWDSDSTLSIVPNSCLRQRVKADDDDGNSDEESTSSSSDEEEENHSSDRYKAREYILNTRKEELNKSEQVSTRMSGLHLRKKLMEKIQRK